MNDYSESELWDIIYYDVRHGNHNESLEKQLIALLDSTDNY